MGVPVKTIIKEAAGRFENAAGSISSPANMFEGSKGNAVSDKIGDGSSNNPLQDMKSKSDTTDVQTDSESEQAPSDSSSNGESVSADEAESFSDERLKIDYKGYNGSSLRGRLKDLDLEIKPPTPKGGGMPKGGMGASGESAEGAEDAGDMADAAEAAEAASDERIKNIFGDNEDIIKCFARINAIQFTYNDKAKEIPGSENKGVDDDVHFGVKAQELAKNPITESAISKDPNSGYLQVDTKEITLANSAVLSEVCKRLEVIEKVLGIKVV